MRARNKKQEDKEGLFLQLHQFKLLAGIAAALIVTVILIMSVNPGVAAKGDIVLTNAMVSEKAGLEINSDDLASRIIEQKFQIHMQEADQQMGEIPYIEVWVLNDPFYPLIGQVNDLRNSEGILSGKEWQMLGFPTYEQQQQSGGSTSTSAPSQAPAAAPVAASAPQRVVIVESIYEVRGIRYAIIKVNDRSYDRLKAGTDFADVFKVQEIKDNKTVIVVCGDETYELNVNELRKI